MFVARYSECLRWLQHFYPYKLLGRLDLLPGPRTIQDGSMPSFGMALAPSLGAPALGAPLGGPSLGAPSLGAPSLGAPSLGAPLLGAPSLGAPLLGAPLLGAPFAPAWPKYGIEDDEI